MHGKLLLCHQLLLSRFLVWRYEFIIDSFLLIIFLIHHLILYSVACQDLIGHGLICQMAYGLLLEAHSLWLVTYSLIADDDLLIRCGSHLDLIGWHIAKHHRGLEHLLDLLLIIVEQW